MDKRWREGGGGVQYQVSYRREMETIGQIHALWLVADQDRFPHSCLPVVWYHLLHFGFFPVNGMLLQ